MTPRDEADVAEAVRAAAARGEPLEIRGGGTRGIGHAVRGTPLALSGLSGITLYEPGALTLVARAGTPLAEVEAALAAEGQRLPFEPWDGRALTGANGAPTLGGMVAVNASGPRRIQAGACRDSLIGVRFVDGTGTIVKNGGRVMKNVTGLDLVKLVAGAHGTLGVLTEVAFKLLPVSHRVATVVLDGLAPEAAGRAMAVAMGAPYDVTGAAHAPAGLGPGPVTLLRLEGFEGAVSHRIAGLTRALAEFGPARVVEGPGDWAALRDMTLFAGRPGAVWRISVKPSDGPALGARLGAAGAEAVVYDWAGGLLTVLADEGLDMRAAMAGISGHATLIRASEEAKARHGVFHPEPAPIAALSAGLRAKFDPKGVLNPGRMVPAPALV
ncbi:FAD-binding protein [Amaricoccus solimangrovi]|uniref:FAD-binding protein n=1 Tax=Amaricoccus solimangrovi TaxID=2589815 RepID=A0A501WRR5_9RHOB|nr:FAD-binding protein [Amaricoccus solimangrovi]TPE51522.1 FAD-binding protein [Amaricoccus solimangrovi]